MLMPLAGNVGALSDPGERNCQKTVNLRGCSAGCVRLDR
jgi:hypothetical protein